MMAVFCIFLIFKNKVVLAFSPLIAVIAVLLTAFESTEEEKNKRKKKDFNLEGHGE